MITLILSLSIAVNLKLEFTQEVALVPTQPWVQAPKHIILTASGTLYQLMFCHPNGF